MELTADGYIRFNGIPPIDIQIHNCQECNKFVAFMSPLKYANTRNVEIKKLTTIRLLNVCLECLYADDTVKDIPFNSKELQILEI